MAYTLISTGDGSGVSPVTLSNVPQTYKTLILDITISHTSPGSFGLRFNNDTSSLYNYMVTGTWGNTRGVPDSAITLASNMPASVFTRFLIKIPNYVGTGGHGVSWTFFSANGNGGMGNASYRGSGAITTINVAPSGNANFAYELWGLS